MERQLQQIKVWIAESRLIRLTYVVAKQGKRVVHGRIIRLDEKNQTILIYLDDEKRVSVIDMQAIEVMEPADYPGIETTG